ncbi:interleukin-10 receptor subunit alpha isoform X1 [Serinus canaria]|uniref:interleukin-10 receptor subunit alpha isoform X1 n=1 Tax=Serinus canaria TaxID=9135 RepID=UPI0008DB6F79|nr:interleukin-10 receptor subunit alpha isoform X1 [Serinus canaria]
MVPSATALALSLALLLACPAHGEELARPRSVRITTEMGWPLLRWEPGVGCPSDARYDVEYIAYGTGVPWTAIPECSNTSEHSCDLTRYTPEPEQRYHARVRAVTQNLTSFWERTGSFFPQQAGPRLAGQSLSVMGNSIQVRLQLLLQPGNVSLEYSDFQREMSRYHVHLRRTRDNHTITVVKNSSEFTIRGLFWLTEYCLSVEPSLANRPVPTTRSAEQCVTTGHRDRSAELLPTILSSSFIILSLLGLLGALLLARTYIRKPVRTPSALKSFMKQSSLWVEHEPPSSGSLDADPIQQLFLCHKEHQPDSSPDSSPSTAQPPLEQGWKLPAWPKDQLGLLGPTGSRDSSGTSTDSGICLHIPSSSSSSSLSCSTGPEPQGYRQQLPMAEDSGVGLESPCPAAGCSSGSGNTSPGLCPAPGQAEVEFRGYLQQSKGTVEPERAPEQGEPLPGCAGSVQGLGSTEAVLDMECSELAVAKGYLKQSSPEHPLTQHLAPWGAPACHFSSQVGPQVPTLLSWAAPGAPLTSKASPDLKTPFDLNIFSSTAFLGPLPLMPSLGSSWIPLPTQALGQPRGDSKDSRL